VRTAATVGAAAVVLFSGLYYWSLYQMARLEEELVAMAPPRGPGPEARPPDGFVPVVDAALRAELGSPGRLTYEAWYPPAPIDLWSYRGWAVRVRYRLSDRPDAPAFERIAVVSGDAVDVITTDAALAEVAGVAGPPR
jgi:hypothetical protein